eukprot:gene4067-5092_t
MDNSNMETTSHPSYSHSSNYYHDRSLVGRNQLSTQFPTTSNSSSPPPVTILSILKEGRITLGEFTNSWNENGDWLLRSLVMCINQLLSVGDQYPNNHSQFLPEHMKLPMITIDGYIARILKYSPFVNSYNIHRILITSVLVAAKYLDGKS